MEIQMPN